MTAQTMLVNIGADAGCPSALLEFPKQDVDPGEGITIRVWAPDPVLLSGYQLSVGQTSLGSGSVNSWPGQTTCKYFEFSGDNAPQQFDYPIIDLSGAMAFSPLYAVSTAGEVRTLANSGADVGALFTRRGYSCLAPVSGLPSLYGTVHAVGIRAPYCLEWTWTAPAAPRGAQWFFLREDGDLKHRFSLRLSEDPPDTSKAYTDIKIRIIGRRTGGVVVGADVWLAGEYLGQSNARYGYVKRNRILSGTYPVRVAKSGYTASDADTYTDNDSVVIPASGGEVRVKIGSTA